MEQVTRGCVVEQEDIRREKLIVFFAYYYYSQSQTINDPYADGLLISHRQHIWTYVAGLYDNRTYSHNCQCAAGGGDAPPPFVGANHYCESGDFTASAYYFGDPLWDGSDCYSSTNCCTNSTLPWFYQQLSETTTSDIEARICN